MRLLRNGVCIAVIAVLLAGCAYVYNYRVAELWLRWYVGDYVQWDRGQEQLFRERLHAQLHWHRTTQLQRYRTWLAQARSDVAGNIDIALLERHGVELREFWGAVMAQLEPDFIHFLSDLSPGQARDLVANFRDEQAERSEELRGKSSAELNRERSHDMVKNIQRWTGRLDAAQKARIDHWAQSLPDSREPWLASRERWIGGLEQALAQRDDADAFARQVHLLFVTPEDLWDPAYRQLLEGNTQITLNLMVDIHNSLSMRQRGALDRNIEQWMRTLDELAAGG